MKIKYLNIASISLIGYVAATTPNLPSLSKLTLKDKQQIILKLNAENLAREKLLKAGNIVTPKVGYGFDSRTGMAINTNCLYNVGDPSAIEMGNSTGRIDFAHSLSSNRMAEMLNAGISGGVDFGLFSASVSGNYVRDNAENRYRTSFNYAQTATVEENYNVNEYGSDYVLNNAAKLALADGKDRFTTHCGDSYITSAQVGALLMVSVSIDFTSAAQKQAFDASASGHIAGIGSIAGHFLSSDTTSTKNATLKISAIQLGGDTTKLANIFGQPNTNGYYALDCMANNIEACTKMVTAIIAYAQGDFQKTIDFDNPKSKLYTFDTSSRLYDDIGVRASLPILTPEEKAAKQYLVSQIKEDNNILDYLKAYQLQSFYPMVTSSTQDALNKAIAEYQEMINEYNTYDVVYACYGSLNNINTKCVDAANDVKAMHARLSAKTVGVVNSLTSTYLIEGAISPFKLVPTSVGDANTGAYANGLFMIYDVTGKQFTDLTCYVDGSPDNNYANWVKEMKGKYIRCFGNFKGNQDMYVNRASGWDNNFGIEGRMINGTPVDYLVEPHQGINAFIYYSNSKNFLYSPI